MCFDYCFNRQIPRDNLLDQSRVIIRPSAGTFITGIAKQYSDTYPPQLTGYLS